MRLVVHAEFSICPLETKVLCEGLSSNLGVNEDNIVEYWLILIGLFIAFRLSALYLLRRKATIFF